MQNEVKMTQQCFFSPVFKFRSLDFFIIFLREIKTTVFRRKFLMTQENWFLKSTYVSSPNFYRFWLYRLGMKIRSYKYLEIVIVSFC